MKTVHLPRLHSLAAVLALMSACILLAPAIALAQSNRHALVIGNASYGPSGFAGNLLTPRNNARRMAEVLEGLGWNIHKTPEQTEDLSIERMSSEIEAFRNGKNTNDELLIFFSGHGYVERGENRLIAVPENPSDTHNSVADLRVNSIDIETIVYLLDEASPSRIIIIIDACSDVPLLPRIDRPQAARIDALKSTHREIFLITSSSDNGYAYEYLDDVDREFSEGLSLFTRHFVQNIAARIPLRSALLDTRDKVFAETSRAFGTGRVLSGVQEPSFETDFLAAGSYALHTAAAKTEETPQPGATDAEEEPAPKDQPEQGQVAKWIWREDPSACTDQDELADALADRAAFPDGGDDLEARRTCILTAALDFFGLEGVTLSGDPDVPVVVTGIRGDSKFEDGDGISFVTLQKTRRERPFQGSVTDVAMFEDVLANFAFLDGHKIAFDVFRVDDFLTVVYDF